MTGRTGDTSSRRPPGPGGRGLFGDVRDIRADPLGHLTRCLRDYGDVVRARFGSYMVHYLFAPEHVKRVLQENHRNYDKDTLPIRRLKYLLGEGLLTSDGAHWLRQRRIAQPAFHRERIAAFGETMTRIAEDVVTGWRPVADTGRSIDVAREMMRMTLRIVCATLFGQSIVDHEEEVARAVDESIHAFDERLDSLLDWPVWVPLARNRRAAHGKATLDRIVARLTERRRREGTAGRHDLLSLLMDASDPETGAHMSDGQLRDEVLTLLIAGHETTSLALTWTLMLLSQHPAARRTHADELARTLAGRAPTVADLGRLPYNRMILEESLRLYPPAWVIERNAVGPDTVGGYDLPARCMVLMSPYVTHRHPAYWDNPEGFQPERFAPEAVAARPPFAYFPFGGGPRVCIGNGFALLEAQLLLATIAQRYRLDLVPGYRVEPDPLVTLRPKHGMPMTVHSVASPPRVTSA